MVNNKTPPPGDFFVTADSERVTGQFFGSADSKGVSTGWIDQARGDFGSRAYTPGDLQKSAEVNEKRSVGEALIFKECARI